MLARQAMPDGMRAVRDLVTAAAIIAYWNAARLAARNVAAFEDDDLEAALD
jgi:hypothetical protein